MAQATISVVLEPWSRYQRDNFIMTQLTKDLTGKTFGKLSVIKFAKRQNKHNYWLTKCECGLTKEIRAKELEMGEFYTCGCKPRSRKRRLETKIGDIFGRLTVVSEGTEIINGQIYVQCKCSCGNLFKAVRSRLFATNTKSCGCLSRELKKLRSTTHGATTQNIQTRLYKIWADMKNRCNNVNATGYQWYGKKGISVCEQWNKSYINFELWAINNGYTDTLTIDRINNDSGYSPENCRFITRKEQARNRSNNKLIKMFGEVKVLADWFEDSRCVVNSRTFLKRTNVLNWSPEEALTTPPHGRRALTQT